MSAEGDQSVSASHLSTVIEEEDLYDNHLLYSSGVNNSGGTTASQTPTDDESTSRRSSQISESSAAETATSGPSTVPKKSSLRRPIETGASSGARQLVEKRRNKAPLPAVFLVKYLGLASAAGLFGVDSIKRPVDELVKAAGKRRAKTGRPLPIAQLTVLQQGVSVRPHPQSEGGRVDKAFHSIEGVSYAAADPTMRRIFCLVVLPEADQQQQQQ
uniref:PID domain-containing protein n=1 Tax=Macrostomum lignano TaxID=282301 RepID=A0A1I8G645_9PLAT